DTTSGSSNDVPLCVALRTGFSTAKGQSVRLILFQNHRPQFNNNASSVWNRYLGDHIQSRYLITIAVPPNLPANMSSGISYGLTRLKDRKILCIAPDRINVAGKVKVVCFDKGGTLTEQDLGVMRVKGVRDVRRRINIKFASLRRSPDEVIQISD
ncbi:MAG: putative Ca-transporting ATPase, partial [Streblomastix strix]